MIINKTYLEKQVIVYTTDGEFLFSHEFEKAVVENKNQEMYDEMNKRMEGYEYDKNKS